MEKHLKEEDVESIDETYIVVEMEKKKISGFRGDKELICAAVNSKFEKVTKSVRT